MGRKDEQNRVEAKVRGIQRNLEVEKLVAEAKAKAEKAKMAKAKAKKEDALNVTVRITSQPSAQFAKVELPPEAQRDCRQARESRPGIQARGSGTAGIQCRRVPGISGGHRHRAKEIQVLRWFRVRSAWRRVQRQMYSKHCLEDPYS